jgi:hypothetical protein
MLFRWISIHAGPHTRWNKIDERLWAFGVPWSPINFMLGLPPRSGCLFENSPNDHVTWFVRCHVGIHVDFTSILHYSHIPLVPRGSVKWTWNFSTNESAWSVMVTGSQSHVWSGPKGRRGSVLVGYLQLHARKHRNLHGINNKFSFKCYMYITVHILLGFWNSREAISHTLSSRVVPQDILSCY